MARGFQGNLKAFFILMVSIYKKHNTMSEANKNTVKTLSIVLGAFGAYWAFAEFVPEGTIAKTVMAYLMGAALIFGIVFFTGLGNPIKKLYRKIRGIK